MPLLKLLLMRDKLLHLARKVLVKGVVRVAVEVAQRRRRHAVEGTASCEHLGVADDVRALVAEHRELSQHARSLCGRPLHRKLERRDHLVNAFDLGGSLRVSSSGEAVVGQEMPDLGEKLWFFGGSLKKNEGGGG